MGKGRPGEAREDLSYYWKGRGSNALDDVEKLEYPCRGGEGKEKGVA